MQYQSNIRARSRIHFAVEKQEYYILRLYVCSLRYPARKWHAPYCHLWHVRLYNTFRHLTNGETVGEKSYCKQNVFFILFTVFVCNSSHSKKK